MAADPTARDHPGPDPAGGAAAAAATPAAVADDALRVRLAEAALDRLDLDAKVRLTSGASAWSIAADPAIGLGRLVMSDGPVGVRGEEWTPEDPSVQIPSPTAVAATWDPVLVRTAGRLLAQEARRKGVHVLLAPTVNIHRSPRGGRHFESYSEDPLLTGAIGTAYVRGVQDGGVATTVKHFVANDSETDRFTLDARIGERALREIYLAPFEAIVRDARPWGVMAAYNKVNGASMTENVELNAVLREEWGFDGFIVSDWSATRDAVRAAIAGTDVAMPGPITVYGEGLAAAVRDGRVPEAAVDAMARRVLLLAARVGILDGAPPAVAPAELPAPVDGPALARAVAARSFTLLRNEDRALPVDPAAVRTVAVIGLAATEARTSGGGSVKVFTDATVSPLDGLRAALPADVRVIHAVGADPRVNLPTMEGPMTAVFRDADGATLAEVAIPTGTARWMGELPEGVDAEALGSLEVRVDYTPETSGAHGFGVAGVGRFRLAVDGATVYEGEQEPQDTDPASAFLHPPEERRHVELTAGTTVRVSATTTTVDRRGPYTFIGLSLTHGEPLAGPEELIREAERAAAEADVAIVVAATTEDVESEGFDRADLDLPGRQNALVSRVARANPRTVVLVNAGAPVLMPWRDEVAAILLTWFGGQGVGRAVADVLLGAVEPGGRLPTTWPAREEDVPVLSTRPVDGVLGYDEGVFVGYRAWQRAAAEPAYWFGHGLGYTTWDYTGIEVVATETGADGVLTVVEVEVANTGDRAGREVVQLYLAPVEADPDRPDQWLAGFAAVEARPGESGRARITVPARAAQVWDESAGGWRTVAGRYELRAARSHADVRATAVIEVAG